MPRTYVGSLRPSERTPPSPTGLFDWITSMYKLPDEYVAASIYGCLFAAPIPQVDHHHLLCGLFYDVSGLVASQCNGWRRQAAV